ncbi:hypothetical protein EXIGLDRAFT_764872 [Exidia glandulosa HHB12029]|uniref:Uncharacterized protein n=1 Tax=Exidia glandulosa HHB12029 TaxID=1314781 RepID=A0A165KVR7_EXIGL|nr:hypothetical protein EXIGLDRAFT_764872 [Exidia glandulosa HHB12029]
MLAFAAVLLALAVVPAGAAPVVNEASVARGIVYPVLHAKPQPSVHLVDRALRYPVLVGGGDEVPAPEDGAPAPADGAPAPAADPPAPGPSYDDVAADTIRYPSMSNDDGAPASA